MTNPYASADMAHDRDLCEFEANNDAWEHDWDILRKNLTAVVKTLGFTPDGYLDILEKAAGDIIDLHRNEENKL